MRRSLLGPVLATFMTAAVGWAQQETSTVVATVADPRPILANSMLPRVSERVRRAHHRALDQLRLNPGCRDLFADLGADGFDLLGRTVYIPAGREQEATACGRGVAALTSVGGAVTVICRRFDRLSDDKATVILLHEALHFAGMTERPIDPAGRTPDEINDLVSRRCGFPHLLTAW